MGADLILARMPLDVDQEEATRRLLECSLDELLAAFEDSMQISYFEAYDVQANTDDLRDMVRDGLDAAYGQRRDVVIWDFDGREWAIMGQTSWGDMPPEYDAFCMVAQLGLTEGR